MSLPLHDLGSIKVSERTHSYIKAEALHKRIDVAALVRELVEEHVRGQLAILSMAQEFHKSKQLAESLVDSE